MKPEETKILEQVRATVAQQKREDEAAQEALLNPLPGPTRDALALDQSIQAGKWRVREFQDGDWEVLAAFKHPLEADMQEQLLAKFAGKPPPPESVFIPRGPHMWRLAWMMTRPGEEVDDVIRKKGAGEAAELARREFSRVSSFTLATELYPAIMQQIERNWQPVQSYGPAPKSGEDGAPAADENPQSSGQPLTGSAG